MNATKYRIGGKNRNKVTDVDVEMKCVRANSLAYANPTDNNSGQASVKGQL